MYQFSLDFLVAHMVKNVLVMQEIWVESLVGKDPLAEEVAAHSSIPWTEKPGGLRSMDCKQSGMTVLDTANSHCFHFSTVRCTFGFFPL